MIDNIDIDLDDIDEYLNNYDDDKIDDKLVDYIMNSIDDLDKDIIFNVNFKYKDNENKIDKFKKRIDITFNELNEKNDLCIKKVNHRIFIMLVLGMLLIGVSNILKSFELLTFSEVIKVLYWFSFTYVCEEIIYARRKLIKIKKKYDKIFDAKINIKSK